MADVVIRVEELGKKYRLGAKAQTYPTMRDSIAGTALAPFRAARRLFGGGPGVGELGHRPEFWALRDITFDVARGQVLGVIGRNGAGKSTLLKLLSRITEPTLGRIRVRGRIASLLEVGTGFHPELTGRENVFLNGAILGMSRAEILRKFDEIVAFAEVEEFIDTQVKHYSSGMYMRLAFSVAAHLEPEILIVDEVLAVGDGAFQKKCLGKMGEVSAGGRTVLFVSHNMAAVRSLCRTTILLEHGSVLQQGTTDEVMKSYELGFVAPNVPTEPGVIYRCPANLKNETCFIDMVETLDEHGNTLDSVQTWSPVRFRLWYQATRAVSPASVAFWIMTLDGRTILLFQTAEQSNIKVDLIPGRNYVDCFVRQLPISAGLYILGVGLAEPWVKWLFRDDESGRLTVHPADVFGSGLMPSAERALVSTPHAWLLGVP